MKPLPLPNDYTRCMGVTPECPQRLTCARHRDLPENTLLSWARNLNDEGVEECLHYIPYENSMTTPSESD